jgi:hypothetical protein
MAKKAATHAKLFQDACRAVRSLFADRSVSQLDTLRSLSCVRDELDGLIAAVRADIKAADDDEPTNERW